MNYYRHIDRAKVQFDFVADEYEKTILDDEIQALGGKVYHIEPYKRNIFRYMYQIYRIVRDHHYDIVHSNMNTIDVSLGFSENPFKVLALDEMVIYVVLCLLYAGVLAIFGSLLCKGMEFLETHEGDQYFC